MLDKDLTIKFQKDGKKLKVTVRPASYKVTQSLKTEYAIAFRRSLTMGVATRASMAELVKEQGIWTEKNEAELTKSILNISLLEDRLKKAIEDENQDEQRKTALEIVSRRSNLYELVQIKSLPLAHTAESIAEDVQIDTYVALCTYNEDGSKYFKDPNDFVMRRDDRDAKKIYEAVIEKLSESNVDALRNLPENKWLMDNDLIDKDGNAATDEVAKLLEVDTYEIIADASLAEEK